MIFKRGFPPTPTPHPRLPLPTQALWFTTAAVDTDDDVEADWRLKAIFLLSFTLSPAITNTYAPTSFSFQMPQWFNRLNLAERSVIDEDYKINVRFNGKKVIADCGRAVPLMWWGRAQFAVG